MNKNFTGAAKFIRKCVFPNAVLAQLGVVLAGISMLALIRHATSVGLSQTFFFVLGWYEKFLKITIGWLGDWLNSIVNWIFSLFHYNIVLQAHWQHIFVLMNIYFIRDATFYLSQEHRNFGRFTWHLGLGVLLATIFSGASAVFSDTGISFVSSLLVALFPILGLIIYDIVERRWFTHSYANETAFTRHGLTQKSAAIFYFWRIFEKALGLAVFSVLFVWIWRVFLGNSGGAGLTAFVISILIVAIYWISGRASLHYAYVGKHRADLPFLVRVLDVSGTSQLGGVMLGTFLWLVIFLISNAGLGLVGL